MKQFLSILLSFSLSFMFISCNKQAQAPLKAHWEFLRNDVEPKVSEAKLTITNTSGKELGKDWRLYFCLESMIPIDQNDSALSGHTIQGSYHYFAPAAAYEPIPAGESRSYILRFRWTAIRESIRPEGLFFVADNGGKPVNVTCTYEPYTRKEQMLRGIDIWEKTPYADGEYVYQYNESKTAGEKNSDILPLLPQPKKVLFTDKITEINTASIDKIADPSIPQEGYKITFNGESITIYASDDDGFYYAEQTIGKLGTMTNISVIEDSPDMHHRGVMLDIVRNFYPADSVKRVLDMMADLKLNVLHFHISDDEAWRVEIPGLPQLTEQGARRGYTTDEKECLYPMYFGGWDYTDPKNTANGFLTRSEYIDLLQYAKARHIRVIPEIDMPGHMRACKKALFPLLTDSVLEQREYVSAQLYTDNVIAVSNPYALTFIETVVSELKKMYDEADCEFKIFNIGGDEVPDGALTYKEHQAFIDGVLDILSRYGLQPMGWEEITHFCRPESRAICYSWHNGEEKPMEMAQAGYPVVLATANHLYFDFAYCRHHEEKGLDWGGYTDEFRSFDWLPVQHENIIGMNAQLWAECLFSFKQAEYQLYPKMYGLSERAWNNRSSLTIADYTSLVYETLLPLLASTGRNFHIQQPGIHAEKTDNGIEISINKVMNGGKIFYTLGDSRQEYTAPFTLPADFKGIVKAQIEYLGHKSNNTWLWLE